MPDRSKKEQSVIDSMVYVKPTEEKQEKFNLISEEAQIFASKIIDNVPDCADRTHALRLLRDVRMWCNAAISLEGLI